MKILFDECVPTDLRKLLSSHTVMTVTEQGWKGIKNGKLLALAGMEFDIFLTVDKNLSFQQNIETLPLPGIVVHSISNKVKHLALLMPEVDELLGSVLVKRVYNVGV